MNQRYASRPLRHATELRRKCPSCSSALPVADRVCRFCHANIRAQVRRRVSTHTLDPRKSWSWWTRFVAVVVGEEGTRG